MSQGTILSVNHDIVGTWITYIGYFMLYLGLMLILFDKGSRFGDLKKRLDKVKAKKASLPMLALLFFCGSVFGQEPDSVRVENGNATVVETAQGLTNAVEQEGHMPSHVQNSAAQVDSILKANAVNEEFAAKFGKLVVQEDNGRMMPVNTFASKLLRKMSRSDSYNGMNADQVFHSMIESPVFWYNVNFIYLKPANDSIRSIIGVPSDRKYVKAIDFFNEKGEFILAPYLQNAYQAESKTNFDKDFIDISERLSLLDRALSGKILKIFPIPDDPNNKWVSYPELGTASFKGIDSVYTRQILPLYFNSVREAKANGDYGKADQFLTSIRSFQEKYGSAVIPSQDKVDAEVFYNKHDIFTKLYWMYLLASIFLFAFVIARIFKENRFLKSLVSVGVVAVIILFLVHTGGLIWRWYISGHAPWSACL